MAECTTPAKCSEQEYAMACAAGLLVVTVADEIAVHKFAEAIRKAAIPTPEDIFRHGTPALHWTNHRGEREAIPLEMFQAANRKSA